MDKKSEYMIAWREKKIRHLENMIDTYKELINVCLALCVAGNVEKISKEMVSRSLKYRYDISQDEEFYIITRRENEQTIKETEHQG